MGKGLGSDGSRLYDERKSFSPNSVLMALYVILI
jgi:hypothetical protein